MKVTENDKKKCRFRCRVSISQIQLYFVVSGKALSLVCNGFTGDACTPQNMLNYLGSTDNGVAPVDMIFQQIGNSTGINSDSIPARK